MKALAKQRPPLSSLEDWQLCLVAEAWTEIECGYPTLFPPLWARIQWTFRDRYGRRWRLDPASGQMVPKD